MPSQRNISRITQQLRSPPPRATILLAVVVVVTAIRVKGLLSKAPGTSTKLIRLTTRVPRLLETGILLVQDLILLVLIIKWDRLLDQIQCLE